MNITLEDLKLAIDNMYDNLDAETIENWEVDGMDIYINDVIYTLNIKELVK